MVSSLTILVCPVSVPFVSYHVPPCSIHVRACNENHVFSYRFISNSRQGRWVLFICKIEPLYSTRAINLVIDLHIIFRLGRRFLNTSWIELLYEYNSCKDTSINPGSCHHERQCHISFINQSNDCITNLIELHIVHRENEYDTHVGKHSAAGHLKTSTNIFK